MPLRRALSTWSGFQAALLPERPCFVAIKVFDAPSPYGILQVWPPHRNISIDSISR